MENLLDWCNNKHSHCSRPCLFGIVDSQKNVCKSMGMALLAQRPLDNKAILCWPLDETNISYPVLQQEYLGNTYVKTENGSLKDRMKIMWRFIY